MSKVIFDYTTGEHEGMNSFPHHDFVVHYDPREVPQEIVHKLCDLFDAGDEKSMEVVEKHVTMKFGRGEGT